MSNEGWNSQGNGEMRNQPQVPRYDAAPTREMATVAPAIREYVGEKITEQRNLIEQHRGRLDQDIAQVDQSAQWQLEYVTTNEYNADNPTSQVARAQLEALRHGGGDYSQESWNAKWGPAVIAQRQRAWAEEWGEGPNSPQRLQKKEEARQNNELYQTWAGEEAQRWTNRWFEGANNHDWNELGRTVAQELEQATTERAQAEEIFINTRETYFDFDKRIRTLEEQANAEVDFNLPSDEFNRQWDQRTAARNQISELQGNEAYQKGRDAWATIRRVGPIQKKLLAVEAAIKEAKGPEQKPPENL